MTDLGDVLRREIARVADMALHSSLFFVDDCAAECLRWSVDLDLWFRQFNVLNVVSLEDQAALARLHLGTSTSTRPAPPKLAFPCDGSSASRAVFLTSSPLIDVAPLIESVVEYNEFQECFVLCATTEAAAAHHPLGHHRDRDSQLDEDEDVESDDNNSPSRESSAFRSLQSSLEKLMRTPDPFVSVEYIPLHFAAPLPSMFLLPACHDFFPLRASHCGGDLSQLGDNLHHLPLESQAEFVVLADRLRGTLDALGFGAADVYTMGTSAGLVASALAAIPASSASATQASRPNVSLILVDRTVDLSTAGSHTSECLLDRIVALLPRASPLSSDVQVDAISPSGVPDCTLFRDRLAHPESNELLQEVFHLKLKDALLHLRKVLLDCLASAHIPVDLKKLGRPRYSQFCSMLSELAEKNPEPPAQLSCVTAATHTLKLSQDLLWDELAATEKIMKLTATDGSDTSAQLVELLAKFPLPAVLRLFVVAVDLTPAAPPSAAHDASSDDDDLHTHPADAAFCQGIFRCVMREKSQAKYFVEPQLLERFVQLDDPGHQSLLDREKIVEEVLRCIEKRIADVRRDVGCARATVAQYKRGQSLLEKLVLNLVDPSHPALDITRAPSRTVGLGRLFNSLFSGQHHPLSNDAVVIFVLGGVTFGEVKLMTDAWTSRSKQLLVGSTCVTSPDKVLCQLCQLV